MNEKRRITLSITKWRKRAAGLAGSSALVRGLVVICLAALVVGTAAPTMAAADDWVTDPGEIAVPYASSGVAIMDGSDGWVIDANEVAAVSFDSGAALSAAGSESGAYMTDPGELAVATIGSRPVASAARSDPGAYVTDPGELAVALYGSGAVTSAVGSDSFVIDPGELASVAYISSGIASGVELDSDPVAGVSSLAGAKLILAVNGQGAFSGKVDESACPVC